MRSKATFLVVLFLALSTGATAQSGDPWKVKPTTLREALITLDQLFDDTTKYSFMMFPEREATTSLHFGFGMWMRNNWGLWGRSPLQQDMAARGFLHPDDMSAAILTAYHRSLNQSPLGISTMVEHYRASWSDGKNAGFWSDSTYVQQRRADRDAILALFHPGDTIVIHLYASYRKFLTTYASNLKGVAVVQGRITDELKVRLVSLEQKKRHTAEKRVGETFSTSPSSCVLIPPPRWEHASLVLPESL